METYRIQIKTLTLCLGAVVAAEACARLGIQGNTSHPMAVLGAVRLLQAALVIMIVWIREKALASVGLSWKGLIPGLGKGVIWSAGFGLIVLLAGVLLYVLGLHPLSLIHTPLPPNTGHILLILIVGGIIGPIAEEIFFRGILYGFFRRWGALTAILSTTLAFVLAHPVFPAVQVTQIVGGLLFALAYEVEKNLVAPITIHSLGNIAIFGLSLIEEGRWVTWC